MIREIELNAQPAWYNALDAIDQRFVDSIWNMIYRLYPDASTYLHWKMFLHAIGATL